MPNLEPQFHGTPRFRIVSRIGVGTVGEIYKALDETRGSFVALRTLRSVSLAGEALRREFRALRNVRHPSLVSLGELDCVDGLWFYTMEFVEGESLLDYVRPRAQPGNTQRTGVGGMPGELSEVRLRSVLSQLVRASVRSTRQDESTAISSPITFASRRRDVSSCSSVSYRAPAIAATRTNIG